MSIPNPISGMNRILLAVAAGALLLAVLFLWKTSWSTWNPDNTSGRAISKSQQENPGPNWKSKIPPRDDSEIPKDGQLIASPPRHTLSSLLSRWELAASELSGHELRSAQYQIANDATSSLSGMEMAKFFEGLDSDKGGDLYSVIVISSAWKLLQGEDSKAALDWALSLDDESLQAHVLRGIARGYAKTNPEEFMRRIPSAKAAESFLVGHCISIASEDPLAAMDTYFRLLPKGRNYSGLAEVMKTLPEHADFAAISQYIPSDDQSVARDVRYALLNRWCEVNQTKVADHIAENPALVAPDQLDHVVKRWMNTSPRQANEWVGSLEPGIHQDEGYKAISGFLMQRKEPERAWKAASKISDPTRRDQALKQVHATWLKQDPDAAERARLSLGN
jgi:hypothetical protein